MPAVAEHARKQDVRYLIARSPSAEKMRSAMFGDVEHQAAQLRSAMFGDVEHQAAQLRSAMFGDVQRQLLRPGIDAAMRAQPFLPELGPLLGRMMRRPSRGLVAALNARDAALSGDQEMLQQYLRDVLGLRPTRARVEAVTLVLLELESERAPQDVSASVRSRLQQETRNYHPIVGRDRPLRGQPVESLDRPVGEEGLVVSDGVPHPGPPLDDEVTQRLDARQKVERFLEHLEGVDREIAVKRMHTDGWSEAARWAGCDPAVGQAVRRRLQHLVRRPPAR